MKLILQKHFLQLIYLRNFFVSILHFLGHFDGEIKSIDKSDRLIFAGEKKSINPELWQACAGPLVNLPAAGTHVVYFPQGHSEQVAMGFSVSICGCSE